MAACSRNSIRKLFHSKKKSSAKNWKRGGTVKRKTDAIKESVGTFLPTKLFEKVEGIEWSAESLRIPLFFLVVLCVCVSVLSCLAEEVQVENKL